MLPLALILALAALADEPLLPNGDFKEWKDGVPVGWTVSIGATSPGEKESEIAPGPDGGVLLRGDAETGRWRSLTREVALEPGSCYRLSFEARGYEHFRDEGQFDNSWIGIALLDDRRKTVSRMIAVIGERGWAPDEMVFRSGTSVRAAVTLFLSKTGSMEARGVVLERLRPEDSYEVLVRHMARYYSHFASKGIDPAAWAEKHRAKAAAAKSLPEWVAAARTGLSDLQDTHCWLVPPDGKTVHTFVPGRPRNIDGAVLQKVVPGFRALDKGRLGAAGTVGDGYGYLAIGHMPTKPEEFAPVLEALDGMLDRPGILIDLRGNIGGDEGRGLEFAERFCRFGTAARYALVRVRNGARPTDLSLGLWKVVRGRDGVRCFEGPVVVLIGPGCVSSGEGLAQMMAAIEGVTLVGQPTAGASGNPQPVELPNGVVVHFSRWLVELPDGTPLEGRGVPPDILVKHEGEGDPTLAEGIRILDAARKGEKR